MLVYAEDSLDVSYLWFLVIACWFMTRIVWVSLPVVPGDDTLVHGEDSLNVSNLWFLVMTCWFR